MKFKTKRASLSLSIDMIVFVVIGFVMLGLMLTLGRKIVEGAGETSSQVSEQTKQQIINELTKSDSPLYFNQREFDVNFGQKKTITFGIKNINPTESNLAIIIVNGNGTPMAPKNKVSMFDSKDAEGVFFWDNTPQRLGAGAGKVFDVQYYAPKSKNTYLFKFMLYDVVNNQTVSEQTIFMNVN
jgi:hypothetical protein